MNNQFTFGDVVDVTCASCRFGKALGGGYYRCKNEKRLQCEGVRHICPADFTCDFAVLDGEERI